MTSPLLAAQIQDMGSREPNQKLATAMSVLSVALVATLVVKELSHCFQERLREHDREYEKRHSGQGDRGR